jgi:hypothetical protein
MTDLSSPPDNLDPPRRRDFAGDRPPWYVGVVGGLLLLILIIVVALLISDDENPIATSETTTTASAPTLPSTTASLVTTTTAGSSTSASISSSTATSASSSTTTSSSQASTTPSTSTTIDPQVFASAVWPNHDSSVRYDNPRDAAAGFAADFLGFAAPVVGPYLSGDGRSGEVEIQPRTGGRVTTVFVRQLGPNNTWWVLGSAVDRIALEQPTALDEIDSPVRVSGEAMAPEGTIQVQLRADGGGNLLIDRAVPVGTTALETFETDLVFANPGAGSGALLLVIRNVDGSVEQAGVVRVVFAGD